MRVAVFLPNWIGDVAMATPALRAIRQLAGQGSVVAVLRPYVSDVLAGTSWIDEEIHYQPGSKLVAGASAGDLRTSAAVARLRAARCDLAILLTNSLRTRYMAWCAGVPNRIGTGRDVLGRFLLTTAVTPPGGHGRTSQASAIDSYLHIAYAAGAPLTRPQLELATTAGDEAAADAVWESLRLPHPSRVVLLNSGGAFGGAKHWPAEHFAELARRLVDELGYSVLVNCGPAEREIARQVATLADRNQVVSLANCEVPLGLTKALIRRSRGLVTTDSGPRFFAVAFRKPVVTLFGPTSPAASHTHYAGETTLTLDLDCQPCWKRTCPLGHHRCMRDLGVDMVYRAIARRLTENPSAVA